MGLRRHFGLRTVGALVVGLVLSATGTQQSVSLPRAPSAASLSATPVPGGMTAVSPRRVLDTRTGLGAPAGPRTTGSLTRVTVLGMGEVPPTGVAAVVVTLTVTSPTGNGFVTAYSGVGDRPGTSALTWAAGSTLSNTTTVPVADDGTIALSTGGQGSAQLIADLAGWIAAEPPTDPGATQVVTPSRVLDTRVGLGAPKARLAAGSVTRVQLTERSGLPTTVGSVTLTLTAVNPSQAGYLSVTPTDSGSATTSSINFAAGQTIANTVTTSVSPTGGIDIRASAATDVLLDLTAYTLTGTPTLPGTLTPSAPTRILDTRVRWEPVVAGEVVTVSTTAGSAAILNVTAVPIDPRSESGAGFVTVSALGTGTPNASQVSFTSASPRAAQVVVPADSDGRIRLLASADTHLVVDRIASLSANPVPAAPLAVTSLSVTTGSTGNVLTWTAPPGAAGVTIRRSGSREPTSPYSGIALTSLAGTATTYTDTALAPGVTYRYAVYARTAWGDSSEPARAASVPLPALAWSAPEVLVPAHGPPTSVSCASASFCMSVAQGGETYRFDGTNWTFMGRLPAAGSQGGFGLLDISCPTPDFCLALGRGWADPGTTAYALRSGDWSSPMAVDINADHVSCASATSCVLAETDAYSSAPRFVRFNGSGFTTPIALTGRDRVNDLDCPTSTICYLATTTTARSGRVDRLSGSTLTAMTTLPYTTLRADLSCSSSTFCMATAGDQFTTFNGGSWSAVRDYSLQQSVYDTYDLSCASPTSCMAVVMIDTMYAARWNGSSWAFTSLDRGINTSRALDCPSTTMCLLVDGRGMYRRWNGSSWSARTFYARSTGSITDLECMSSTQCTLSDNFGNVVDVTPTSHSPLLSLMEGGTPLSCISGFCLATSPSDGTWRTRTSAGWHAVRSSPTDPVLDNATCSSASRCHSPSFRSVSIFDGSGWRTDVAVLPVDLGDLRAGRCTGSTFCMFLGSTGAAVRWNGSSYLSAGTVPLSTRDYLLDCLSTAFCLATSGTESAIWNGSSWQALPRAASTLGQPACLSTSSCVAFSGTQQWAWDSREWSPTSASVNLSSDPANPAGPEQLRCTATFCVAAFEGSVSRLVR
ncbi:MAG: fibronectin type III domain-containing protein [Tetrasphaera sp.]|nr:fibronectin type III domain-containing protein [Tetrasphaera sp.]